MTQEERIKAQKIIHQKLLPQPNYIIELSEFGFQVRVSANVRGSLVVKEYGLHEILGGVEHV